MDGWYVKFYFLLLLFRQLGATLGMADIHFPERLLKPPMFQLADYVDMLWNLFA